MAIISRLPKDSRFVGTQDDLFDYDKVDIYRSPGGRKYYSVCSYTKNSVKYRVIYSDNIC